MLPFKYRQAGTGALGAVEAAGKEGFLAENDLPSGVAATAANGYMPVSDQSVDAPRMVHAD